ncbi:hypothetical protein E2C01_002002 [Portunus trituberculatus]|uniref:Uncharacterized protein n=1 Tax=Portunus trituberculatus TaxID=210409 RepID=A0A5B7CKR9_PORTR|nr:hypothetical protein [Portunus trituberculatus]
MEASLVSVDMEASLVSVEMEVRCQGPMSRSVLRHDTPSRGAGGSRVVPLSIHEFGGVHGRSRVVTIGFVFPASSFVRLTSCLA